MELNKKLIGIRIMQHRKALGLTQETLAKQIGCSKNHLSSIERGKYIPTTQLIFNICNTLGGTPDYYLIGKVSKDADRISALVQCLPEESQRVVCRLIETYLEEIHAI